MRGETAFFLSTSFWGFAQMVRANADTDLEKAQRMLEAQNRVIYNGIGLGKGNDALWNMLRERGRRCGQGTCAHEGKQGRLQEFPD